MNNADTDTNVNAETKASSAESEQRAYVEALLGNESPYYMGPKTGGGA